MLKKNIHMQDQISNRIEIIMDEKRIPVTYLLEELSIAVLLVAVFIVAAGFH